MANPIKITDAVKYYRGLPGQVSAWEYLDKALPAQIREEFQALYRTPPPPKTEKPPVYLHCSLTGKFDNFGLRVMTLALMNGGKAVDKVTVCSGQSYAQDLVHPTQDYSGSMRICPEGVYDIGEIDDIGYTPGPSDGFGRYVIPIYQRNKPGTGQPPNNRSALLLHSDHNRANSPGCFDIKDTYVLTRNGWVSACDIDTSMAVAQMSDNFEIVFKKPLKVIRESYNGSMISLKTNKLNMLVTPEHRICKTSVKKIESWKSRASRVSYITAKELHESHLEARIPLSGLLEEEGLMSMPRWKARLMIAFLSDGYHEGGAIFKGRTFKRQTAWHLKRQRKIDRLEEILKEGRIDYKLLARPDGSVVIKVDELPFKKQINPELALQIPLETRLVMLRELICWDGTSSSSSSSQKYCVNISTKDPSQADFYELLAIMSGYGCKRSLTKDPRNESWSPLHRLNIVDGRVSYAMARPENEGSLETEEVLDYSGTVFCLETETTNFLVKHQGSVFVSGNSAGCLCPYNAFDMGKIVAWMEQHSRPQYLIVNLNQGYLAGFSGVYVPKK